MTMWNTDTVLHTPSTDSLYVSIPFFIGFEESVPTVYSLTVREVSFDMGKTSLASICSRRQATDWIIISSPDLRLRIVEQYAGLTGTMELPPLWALGYHQSRYSYCPQEDVEEVAKNFRQHDFPCDAIYLDIHYMDGYRIFTFDGETFPDPSGLIACLKELGFKTVTIIDPGVNESQIQDIQGRLAKGLLRQAP